MCFIKCHTDWSHLAWFHPCMSSCLLLQLTVVWTAETTVYLHVCSQFLFIPTIHNKKKKLVFICVFIPSLVSLHKMENGSLTQFILDGLQDAVWVAQHAGCCCADLNEVFSHGLTQEHRVECRYFIHSHRSHFQHFGDLNENNYKHSVRFAYVTHTS